MLTARGTAILATVIMQDSYARLEEYIRNHSDSFGDLSEQDRAQYHVNAWREGPGIYERLDKAIPKGKMLRHGNENMRLLIIGLSIMHYGQQMKKNIDFYI